MPARVTVESADGTRFAEFEIHPDQENGWAPQLLRHHEKFIRGIQDALKHDHG